LFINGTERKSNSSKVFRQGNLAALNQRSETSGCQSNQLQPDELEQKRKLIVVFACPATCNQPHSRWTVGRIAGLLGEAVLEIVLQKNGLLRFVHGSVPPPMCTD